MTPQSVYRILTCLLLSGVISSGISQQATPNQTPPATESAQVTVTVTVTDHAHHPVADLKAENFTLYEDGQPHPINSVTFGDVPACIGLLVDRSNSMRPQVAAINKAIMDLVRASNSGDQFFVVSFTEVAHLDKEFTQDQSLIEQALARSAAGGATALYDAVIASATYLANARGCKRRILVIMSDGNDNQSRKTSRETISYIQKLGNPAIYAIGVRDESRSSSALQGPNILEKLADQTGGEAFSDISVKDLGKLALKVAEEIRNTYTFTYVPVHPQPDVISKIKLEAHADGYKHLTTRVNVAFEPVANTPSGTAPGK
ncbi:MAG TPA: VWA domain-containing protein [Candidatus Angelobacter sp.]|nr:VWA domain-containing protein [Candidatus Angelobacter sp.]